MPSSWLDNGGLNVTLQASGHARGIFAIYLHQGLRAATASVTLTSSPSALTLPPNPNPNTPSPGASFTPPAHEAQGRRPGPAPARPAVPDTSPYQHLLQEYEGAVEAAKQFQLYGPAWDARVANGTAPALMTGAMLRGGVPGDNHNVSDWQNHVLCSTLASNNNYLRIMEMWARAYVTPGHRHTGDPELLQRVVAAIDFYRRAQGSNGGYDDRNHGFCWVGGPSRQRGSGCLEGYGHMGFSHAFFLLRKVFQGEAAHYLTQPVDDDFDPSTPNVTRRAAWSDLMLLSRNYLASSVGRGHAPNQVRKLVTKGARLELCVCVWCVWCVQARAHASRDMDCAGDHNPPYPRTPTISTPGCLPTRTCACSMRAPHGRAQACWPLCTSRWAFCPCPTALAFPMTTFATSP